MSNLDVSDMEVLSELERLQAEYKSMMVIGSPIEWVTVVAMLQLASRHPAVTDEQKAATNKVCGSIQAMLSEASEPIGLMLEAGWHEKYDVPSAIQDFVLAAISIESDGDSQLDITYHAPLDYTDERWQHDVFVYGIGGHKYVVHAFWATGQKSLEIYRMVMGLLSQVEPMTDDDDLSWMEFYNG